VATVQKWGREESWIWPPRGFHFTQAAVLAAALLSLFLMYLRFHFGLHPLEQYYLPYYLRSESLGTIHPIGTYQLLYVVSSGQRAIRLASDSDVQPGLSVQPIGKALPFQLSQAALEKGWRSIWREPPRRYQNQGLHKYLERWVYGGATPLDLIRAPLFWGGVALLFQLPFSVRRDLRRRLELRYGRRIKGPMLVSPRAFSRDLEGDGIGFVVEGQKRPLRIPRAAENKHILTVGETGAGKSTIIRQILFQVDERKHGAIVYDPAGEFIQQFYDERRGDIVLNPLDARCILLESFRRIAAQGRGKSYSGFAVSAGGHHQSFLR